MTETGERGLGHEESPGFSDGGSAMWLPDPCTRLDPLLSGLPPGQSLDFNKNHASPATVPTGRRERLAFRN